MHNLQVPALMTNLLALQVFANPHQGVSALDSPNEAARSIRLRSNTNSTNQTLLVPPLPVDGEDGIANFAQEPLKQIINGTIIELGAALWGGPPQNVSAALAALTGNYSEAVSLIRGGNPVNGSVVDSTIALDPSATSRRVRKDLADHEPGAAKRLDVRQAGEPETGLFHTVRATNIGVAYTIGVQVSREAIAQCLRAAYADVLNVITTLRRNGVGDENSLVEAATPIYMDFTDSTLHNWYVTIGSYSNNNFGMTWNDLGGVIMDAYTTLWGYTDDPDDDRSWLAFLGVFDGPNENATPLGWFSIAQGESPETTDLFNTALQQCLDEWTHSAGTIGTTVVGSNGGGGNGGGGRH